MATLFKQWQTLIGNQTKETFNEFWEEYSGAETKIYSDILDHPQEKMTGTIGELAEKYDGKIVVGKCDVEENEDLAAEFGVRNIPTILFFKGGVQVDKVVGAQSKDKFIEKIEALL